MSNIDQYSSSSNRLLPEKWHRAPIDFYQRDKLAAIVFVVVNFLFGTVGIWLPIINTVFGPSSLSDALQNQFKNGSLYV